MGVDIDCVLAALGEMFVVDLYWWVEGAGIACIGIVCVVGGVYL